MSNFEKMPKEDRKNLKITKNDQPLGRTKKTKISSKTNQVYAQKFIKLFEKETRYPSSIILIHPFTSQVTTDFDHITFADMCKIMHRTGLIKNIKELDQPNFIQERTLLFDMWLVLRGDKYHYIRKRNFLVFIFAILGIKYKMPKENYTEVKIH